MKNLFLLLDFYEKPFRLLLPERFKPDIIECFNIIID
jgi:hypothetical protein